MGNMPMSQVRRSRDNARRLRLVRVQHDAIAPRLLRLVERRVSEFQNAVHRAQLQIRHAPASRYLHEMFMMRPRTGCDGGPYSLGQLDCRRRWSVRREDDEFFAAVTTDEVFSPAGFTHHLRHAAQDVVAKQMAISIVDLL